MTTTNDITDIEISIVIPIYNEKENIPILYELLEKVLHSLNLSYEIIFVNDGSSDKSLEEIARLHEQNPQIKGISLSRNFGHQLALSAGLDHARGRGMSPPCYGVVARFIGHVWP